MCFLACRLLFHCCALAARRATRDGRKQLPACISPATSPACLSQLTGSSPVYVFPCLCIHPVLCLLREHSVTSSSGSSLPSLRRRFRVPAGCRASAGRASFYVHCSLFSIHQHAASRQPVMQWRGRGRCGASAVGVTPTVGCPCGGGACPGRTGRGGVGLVDPPVTKPHDRG